MSSTQVKVYSYTAIEMIVLDLHLLNVLCVYVWTFVHK